MSVSASAADKGKSSEWYGMKFVGDNVDKKVKPRYMRSDHQSTDLHYFHMYATQDHVDFSNASEEPPSINPDPVLNELLPSADDREAVLFNFVVLIIRQLTQYMPFFERHFSDVVVDHIPHDHQAEMEQISEVVNLIH